MPGRLVALVAIAAALGVATTRAIAEDENVDETDTLTVSGTGRISAAPDLAEINAGVVTQAATARDALAANNEAMGSLHRVLKERGVAAKDVQTTNINISPQYSQPRPLQPGQPQPANNEPPRIAGYQVTNTVRVTSRELDKLGQVLDAVVQAGANQMYGIHFRIDEPEKLLDECRKRAVADARRKAELLAGEAGVVLGRPIRISESGGPNPPPIVQGRAMAMAPMAAVPVAPGEQDLQVTVSIVYKLKAAK